MVHIPKPKKPESAAEKPTTMTLATEKASPTAIKPLQVKLVESLKNEVKAYAASKGKSMSQLFIEMYQEYKANHSE
jgi:cell envelope opacity-associated protein A